MCLEADIDLCCSILGGALARSHGIGETLLTPHTFAVGCLGYLVKRVPHILEINEVVARSHSKRDRLQRRR